MSLSRESEGFNLRDFIIGILVVVEIILIFVILVFGGLFHGRIKVLEWSVGDLEQWEIDQKKYRENLYDRTITKEKEYGTGNQ